MRRVTRDEPSRNPPIRNPSNRNNTVRNQEQNPIVYPIRKINYDPPRKQGRGSRMRRPNQTSNNAPSFTVNETLPDEEEDMGEQINFESDEYETQEDIEDREEDIEEEIDDFIDELEDLEDEENIDILEEIDDIPEDDPGQEEPSDILEEEELFSAPRRSRPSRRNRSRSNNRNSNQRSPERSRSNNRNSKSRGRGSKSSSSPRVFDPNRFQRDMPKIYPNRQDDNIAFNMIFPNPNTHIFLDLDNIDVSKLDNYRMKNCTVYIFLAKNSTRTNWEPNARFVKHIIDADFKDTADFAIAMEIARLLTLEKRQRPVVWLITHDHFGAVVRSYARDVFNNRINLTGDIEWV